MNWIKENWFKLSIVLAGFVIAYAFYQNLVIIPRDKESARSFREIQEKLDKDAQASRLDACLVDAEIAYSENWENLCKRWGIDNKDENCSLPRTHADRAEEWKKEAKEDCYKKYL